MMGVIATRGILTLDQKALARHLLWLLQAHGFENRGSDISEHAVGLLETPALGGVGHDEGDFVGGMGGLGLAVFEFHFFGVSTHRNRSVNLPGGDEEEEGGEYTRDPR